MRRRIGLGLGLGALVFFHLTGHILPSSFWFWSPIIFLVMFYFWVLEDPFSSALIFTYFIFFVLIASLQAASIIFLPTVLVLLRSEEHTSELQSQR